MQILYYPHIIALICLSVFHSAIAPLITTLPALCAAASPAEGLSNRRAVCQHNVSLRLSAQVGRASSTPGRRACCLNKEEKECYGQSVAPNSPQDTQCSVAGNDEPVTSSASWVAGCKIRLFQSCLEVRK
jgi:hypothetical protein